MKKHKYYSKQGFTIIEVVLVLAIAGLIFLMVFIALPALQRSQRDAQRKRIANMTVDAFRRYVTNTRSTRNLWNSEGVIKNLIDKGYLKADEVRDPSTGELPFPADIGKHNGVYAVYKDLKAGEYGSESGYCKDNKPVDTAFDGHGAEMNNYLIVVGLESGGWYCASLNSR